MQNIDVDMNSMQSIKSAIDFLIDRYDEVRHATAWENFKKLAKLGSEQYESSTKWHMVNGHSLGHLRIRNCLLLSNIENFGELLSMTGPEIKQRLGIGTNNFRNLRKYLWTIYGIDLK